MIGAACVFNAMSQPTPPTTHVSLAEHGAARLDGAAALLAVLLASIPDAEGYVASSVFERGPDPVPCATDAQLRKAVLRKLGAIAVQRGPGGLCWVLDDARASGERVLKLARSVWGTLLDAPSYRMDAARISTVAGDGDGAVGLLRLLGLVAGVQRAGGIRVSPALLGPDAEVADEVAPDDAEAGSETHEAQYYDAVASVLAQSGCSTTVTGRAQRGAGEWSTPDVVGWYVQPTQSLIVPVVRALSVEVKHELTRLGIAEAASHRRFAHYAYVAVPVARVDLDADLVAECQRQGVGLICPSQRGSRSFYVQFDPPFHRPDEEEVDALLASFRASTGEPLAEVVAREVRKAMRHLFG